jgi:hypothetical protein
MKHARGESHVLATTGLLVIENIHESPDLVRADALKSKFFQPHPYFPWYVSVRSSSHNQELARKLSNILGQEIFDADSGGAHSTSARFCVGLSKANPMISIHTDPFMWAAIVYLTPNAPRESGTYFYRHLPSRRIRRRRRDGETDLVGMRPLDVCQRNAAGRFSIRDKVDNVYNRLVVYDARFFHSPACFFGDTLKTGRLSHVITFNTGKSYRG